MLLLSAPIAATLFALPCVVANQFPFLHQTSPEVSLNFSSGRNDAGVFSPQYSSLSALPEKEWAVLSHPLHPKHSVRIKKTNICNDTANGYTGYIDFGARHLFFYFFESRNDPDTDDVIFWTNGGPGGSSASGLFFELGPCRIINEDGPKFHPESWNTNANIFFIDQPIGVGFSYAEFGETVVTTEDAAIDVAAFVSIFFDNFSQFKGRSFHMAGESYGGRYLPIFASAVYDQNEVRIGAGLPPINLTSVMIGNGLTDTTRMILSYYDYQCTHTSVEPFVDISSCIRMKGMVDRCEKWMRKACLDHFDLIDCTAAYDHCGSVYSTPFYLTGRNPYDVRQPCHGELTDTICYPQTTHIRDFLNDPTNRAMLGVDDDFKGKWAVYSPLVNSQFEKAGDYLHTTTDYVAALLERDIRVLIYVGTSDWICNHIGNERWTLAMDWSGKKEFVEAEKREWFVDGKKAGLTRSAKGFTYATVDGAGHMVPYNKPKEALEMIQRWLAKEKL
ncbi:hypothetical protein AGABI1DRAFT_77834 [Agaricus bisporus var. burnettii JB137-S8]|uniref:Carboxypeptidase n=1 Tax=Agaricus bisporus var. burnettii (strain JB137-S8 / ATCC MYA-4627 / FGSC 10392) TaxID=597362 RepID=K5WP04_AGABU|nr:uncharacterized protein AGABI1DRAFT_77834 [Agaricus bisporus var. burnettii JB137-S8]EKM77056.1 hypothetical protein AGABI1DRAFT_77834 [Agaricus bisporus var. burnettii JB137-S8]